MEQVLSAGRDPLEQILVAVSLIQQLQKRALSLDSSSETARFAGVANAQEAIQTGTLGPELALFRIADLALELVPGQGAGVWLFAGDLLVYRAGAGTASDDETLRNAVLSKLVNVERRSLTPSNEEKPSAVCSLLVAPIYQGPRIAGALAVFSENTNCFSPSDLTKLRLLTGLLAQAVDKDANARLRHQVSLERAVVLNVIGAVVPSLAGLVESRQSRQERFSRTAPLESEVVGDSSLRGIESAADTSGELEDPQPAFMADETLNSFNDSPELIQETLLALEAALVSNPNHVVLPKTPPLEQTALDQVSSREESESVSLKAGLSPVSPIQDCGIGTSLTFAPRIESLNVGFAEAGERQVSVTGPDAASSAKDLSKSVSARNQLSFWDPYLQLAQNWFVAIVDDVTHRLENYEYKANWDRHYRSATNAFVAVAANITRRLKHYRHKVKLWFDSAPLVVIGTRVGAATALLAVLLFLIPTVHVPKVQTGRETLAITTVHASETKAESSAPDTSHKRVTDSAAAAALRDLSRFEIPGLLRQARYGDDAAAFTIGMAYETGHGLPQDCAKATHWVNEAASGGNAAAEYNLSLRYREGDGVAPNAEESEKWLRRAAARKYPQAQIVLGKPTTNQTRASLSQP
jgi:TPR repeat protein